MKDHGLLILALVLAGSIVYGQESLTHFSKKDGLSSTWIRACTEDKQGNIWFGTDRGLNKFDGQQLVAYTDEQGMPGDFVRMLQTDKRGFVWVVSGKYAFNPVFLVSSFVPISYYRDLGICVIPDGKTLHYLNAEPDQKYRFGKIVADAQGNIWLGGYDEARDRNFIVRNFDGSSWESLPDLAVHDLPPFYDMFLDSQGQLWTFSGKDPYINRFDGHTLTSFGESDGIVLKNNEKHFNVIYEDSKKRLWLGAGLEERYGTLLMFDGNVWKKYTQDEGLAGKCVKHILEDSKGRIWVATNRGINIYDGSVWISYTDKDKDKVPGSFIDVLYCDSQDRVWIGTSGGLVLYDHGEWRMIDKKAGLTHNWVRSVREDRNGNIWVGSAGNWKSGGVAVLHNGTWTSLQLPSLWADEFFEDSKGNMWILSFGNGIVRLNGGIHP